MNDCNVNILGADWKICYRTPDEDSLLLECDGYTDQTIHTIVVKDWTKCEREKFDCADCNVAIRTTTRHEIVHAFLAESGIWHNSTIFDEGWAMNEEMVDWIARQHEKLHKAFEAVNALEAARIIINANPVGQGV